MFRLSPDTSVRRGGLLTALVALIALALTPFVGARGAASAHNDSGHHDPEPNSGVVRDWNLHAVNALINAPTAPIPGAGQTPPVSALHLAMVQGAVYDAVNSIDGGHQPYLAGLPAASPSASKDAAVATAAHHVLVGLGIAPVPALPQVVIDRLDAPVCRSACRHSRRCRQGRRDRGRRCRSGRDARRENRRRPVRPVLVHRRRRGRRMASDPTWHGQRPVRLGGQRQAVRAPERVAVPVEGPARHQEPCLRQGIQRGEGSRSRGQSTYGRADRSRPLLRRPSHRVVQPHVPCDRRGSRPEPRRRSPSLRDVEHRNGGHADQLLERQGGVRLLASDHRHPRGRQRRQPQDRPATPHGRRSSPRRPARRRIRTTRPATTASARR